MANKHRVVITGIGLVTPVGNDKDSSWQSVIAGKSGISLLENCPDLDPAKPVFAGQVKEESSLLDLVFSKQKQRKASRFIHLAVMAAKEAMKDAGLDLENPINRTKIGSYIGVGIGGLDVVSFGSISLKEKGARSISPFLLPQALINEAPAWINMELNIQGPSVGICNACSSGADAIGMAYRAIKSGDIDIMVAGGSESCITPLSIGAFGSMRVLSSWHGDPAAASRPFSKDRCGFVMAEGSGILILESFESAKLRNANVYAEIVGYGTTSDAYHIIAMQPEGRGAINAINQAISQAEIDVTEIGYVNAHGTATTMNDSVEAAALSSVFGKYAEKNLNNHLLVSSTKSMTGHMLGAAGGVEAAFTALALKKQILPPTINLDVVDENFNLDFIPNIARHVNIKYAMSNSFGFGGGNAVLVMKKV